MSRGAARDTYAVPGAAGTFAPEVMHLCDGDFPAPLATVTEFQLMLDGELPTGASVEVEILRPGGRAKTDADWTGVKSYTGGKLQEIVQLCGIRGVRVRVKSGGTAGAISISVYWM